MIDMNGTVMRRVTPQGLVGRRFVPGLRPHTALKNLRPGIYQPIWLADNEPSSMGCISDHTARKRTLLIMLV